MRLVALQPAPRSERDRPAAGARWAGWILCGALCGATDAARSSRWTPAARIDRDGVGLPVLSLRWSRELADRAKIPSRRVRSPAVPWPARNQDLLFVGRTTAWFFASSQDRAHPVEPQAGATSSRPALGPDLLYIGTDDGHIARWSRPRGASAGATPTRGRSWSPVLTGDLVILSTRRTRSTLSIG